MENNSDNEKNIQDNYIGLGLDNNNLFLNERIETDNSIENNNQEKESREDILFKYTKQKDNEEKYRNKWIFILGNLATREEIFYGKIPELLSKIKKYGLENKLK